MCARELSKKMSITQQPTKLFNWRTDVRELLNKYMANPDKPCIDDLNLPGYSTILMIDTLIISALKTDHNMQMTIAQKLQEIDRFSVEKVNEISNLIMEPNVKYM